MVEAQNRPKDISDYAVEAFGEDNPRWAKLFACLPKDTPVTPVQILTRAYSAGGPPYPEVATFPYDYVAKLLYQLENKWTREDDATDEQIVHEWAGNLNQAMSQPQKKQVSTNLQAAQALITTTLFPEFFPQEQSK